MTKTTTVTFGMLRRLLERVGYRHERVPKGEIFHLSEDRELYFRRYEDSDLLRPRDIISARSFLDDWGQLDAADFDAFLESTSKPA
jgi:hypothetical protein